MARTNTARSDALKKRIYYGLAAAAAGAALSYGGYRLQRLLKSRKQTVTREKMLDDALSDTMDCSDPVATY